MKTPKRSARHAGFFTFGIAIAVLALCGGLAAGGRLLHETADNAAQRVALESDARPASAVAHQGDTNVSSRSSVD